MNSGRNRVQDYAEKFGVEFHAGEKPWGVKADIVMPSAMQNDVHMDSAEKIVKNGIRYYIEVANMPTTNDALRYLMDQPDMIVAPSKAVNAGGVATSGLEMSQNSERLFWTAAGSGRAASPDYGADLPGFSCGRRAQRSGLQSGGRR